MEKTLQVLMRETPLEVLTRAASLVAGCETSASDAGRKSAKRIMSSECELQTNIMTANSTRKCRRVGEIDSPTSSERSFEDEDDQEDGGRRSAATQTLFSSFVPYSGFYHLQPTDPVIRDPVPDEEPCLILDLDQHTVQSSHPYHATSSGHRCASRATTLAMETEVNSPLNLTVTVSTRSLHGPYHPPIMSCDWQGSSLGHCQGQVMSKGQAVASSNFDVDLVPNWRSEEREQRLVSIKIEPSSLQKRTPPYSDPGINSFAKGTSLGKSGQRETSIRNCTLVETDPNIDEHFRRSLGSDYSRVVNRSGLPTSPSSSSSSSAAAPSASIYQGGPLRSQNGTIAAVPMSSQLPSSGSNKSITGAVDEHFAKSLGSAWSKIKLGTGPNNATGNASAVDDHFAKALGETWFQLKAEKRSSPNSSCFV